jgi:hypothetical protein
MGVKQRLTDGLRALVVEVDGIESDFELSARTGSGDFERWGPKDFIAHSAEWTNRQVALLRRPGEVEPLAGRETVEKLNREQFERHRDTPWHGVLRMLHERLEALQIEVDRREDADLLAPDPASGGRHGLWRGIAFYGIVHTVTHLVQALFRAGNGEAALRLQSIMTPLLLQIDASEAWQGTVEYNHARAFALAGDSKALDYARQAVAHNPDAARWLENDPDFASIRDSIADSR